MIKTITIVSLSAGTLGEDFVRHELDLGLQRLRDLGLRVKFAAHALAGRAYLAAACAGTEMPAHPNEGFLLLQGPARFGGPILGGCIDTLFDLFDGTRYADSPAVCRRYGLFPSLEDWRGRLLLLESSEEQPTPDKYRRMLAALKETGVFGVVNGLLIGKPMDERYQAEYHAILQEVVDDPGLPILANLNVGHATPRCILPFGLPARVDADAQTITFAPA